MTLYLVMAAATSTDFPLAAYSREKDAEQFKNLLEDDAKPHLEALNLSDKFNYYYVTPVEFRG